MGWVTGTYTLPKGPRVAGLDAVEVAKSGWEGLKGDEVVQGVERLEEGFDAVFECTGVESCMQLAVMVSKGNTVLSNELMRLIITNLLAIC
jgi:L-iditol 2-dehydrogenase